MQFVFSVLHLCFYARNVSSNLVDTEISEVSLQLGFYNIGSIEYELQHIMLHCFRLYNYVYV